LAESQWLHTYLLEFKGSLKKLAVSNRNLP
jgi:hypothetical protein